MTAIDREKIMNEYLAAYNKIVAKYKMDNIASLVEEINKAIKKANNMAEVNLVYERISDWNNLVSNLQGIRDALLARSKSLKLPSIKEILIIFDHVTKEWRFNTDAE